MNIGDLYKARDEDGEMGWNIVTSDGEAAGFTLEVWEESEFDAHDVYMGYGTHDIAEDTDIVFIRNLLAS
jgi:hypothetical protein